MVCVHLWKALTGEHLWDAEIESYAELQSQPQLLDWITANCDSNLAAYIRQQPRLKHLCRRVFRVLRDAVEIIDEVVWQRELGEHTELSVSVLFDYSELQMVLYFADLHLSKAERPLSASYIVTCICFNCPNFWDDKEYVIESVQLYAGLLRLAAAELRDDEDVVMHLQYSSAFVHASERLRSDKTFLHKAISLIGGVLVHASPAMRQDRDLALHSARSQKSCAWLKDLEPAFRGDREITLAAAATIGADPDGDIAKARSIVVYLPAVSRDLLEDELWRADFLRLTSWQPPSSTWWAVDEIEDRLQAFYNTLDA